MREIVEGIYTWSRFAEPQGYDFNGYFLRHDTGNIVIDPVEPEPEDLETLSEEGVATILLTNRNHSRAANKVRAATGAQTGIHSSDADYAQSQGCVIDVAISVGELWGPLLVIPAPGKSPGEVVLHWPDRRILFVGDAVVGNPPGRLSLLPEEKLDDPGRLRESLRALRAVDFDCLLTGDGVPILSGAGAVFDDLIAGFPQD